MQSDGLGLNDVVAAVDLGEMLAFGRTRATSLKIISMWRTNKIMLLQLSMTYCVSRSIFLLSSNDEALALGGVQSALALDDVLAGSGATLVLGANASNGVPAFAHDCCKIKDRVERVILCFCL